MKTASRTTLTLLLALALGALGCSDDTQGAPDAGADSGPCDPLEDPRCQGAQWPSFALEDFQPKSSRFGQSYGLDVFKGKVTLVALLAGW